MLLHRLVEFADRPASQLPPDYYRSKKIQWVLVLSNNGSGVTLFDRRPAKGTKDKALETSAPHVNRTGTKAPAYLLVDNAKYVFGLAGTAAGEEDDRVRDKAAQCHDAYTALLQDWVDNAGEVPEAQLVADLVRRGGLAGVDLPEEMLPSDNIALMTEDGTWLHDLPSVRSRWADTVRARKAGSSAVGLCLVCGESGALLATIPESVKKGIIPSNGATNEAQLVSINAAAQGRGGVLQLVNTPVCERCGSRAMAALNRLLADDKHRRRGTESVALWWTREPVEDSLFEALDDPQVETVGRLLDTLHDRPDPTAGDLVDSNAYYALTLGANSARVVVHDWLDVPLTQVRTNIAAWFDDHRVFDGWQNADRYLPLWLLTLAAGRWDPKAGKYAARSAPRGLDAELLRAALTRGPLPARLLPHLLQRIRADRRIDAPRTALLRLALHPNRKDEETTGPMPRLDETNTHPGYLCGRAFAVLEAVQRQALPDLNTTIGDKYFGTAMTAPAAVLTNLRKGANAHLKRLRRDNTGAYRALDARLTHAYAVLAGLDDGIPVLLDTRQQAWFVLGYEQLRAEDNAARAAYKTRKESEAAQAEGPGSED